MKPEMFVVAARCFESGQVMADVLRRARERQAARYFWAACGIARGTDGPRTLGSVRGRALTANRGDGCRR